jgi:2-polyprenyl-3-methyl-5-hydroxy-6-metoxy-1,4-benzoquinol methylase
MIGAHRNHLNAYRYREMEKSNPDMSTDSAWEQWGQQDPYFGVITNPKFRRSALNQQALQDFFATSEPHVHHILTAIRAKIDPGFVPRRVLDFGCGVGRLLVPFASVAEEVVGLDVSPSMLREASKVCAERQLRNVRLLLSDDELSSPHHSRTARWGS